MERTVFSAPWLAMRWERKDEFHRMRAFLLSTFLLLVAGSSRSETPPLPGKLAALRESYHRAMERAAEPIRATYVQELRKLRDEYTKAGQLQPALAVDEELNALQPGAPTSGVDSTDGGGSSLGPDFAGVAVDGDRALLPLRQGEKLFADGEMEWGEVPKALSGLKFVQPRGKHEGVTRLQVVSAGMVYIVVTSRFGVQDGEPGTGGMVSQRQLRRDGWRFLGDRYRIPCTDSADYEWLLFARKAEAGETFALRTEKYCAPIVLVP